MNENIINFYLTLLSGDPSVEFQKLAFETNNSKVLTALARTENLAPEIDALLKNAKSSYAVAAWAERPGRSVQDLEELATSKKANVLKALATRENLSFKAYESMAENAIATVSMLLLENPAFPEELRVKLCPSLAAFSSGNARSLQKVFAKNIDLIKPVSEQKKLSAEAIAAFFTLEFCDEISPRVVKVLFEQANSDRLQIEKDTAAARWSTHNAVATRTLVNSLSWLPSWSPLKDELRETFEKQPVAFQKYLTGKGFDVKKVKKTDNAKEEKLRTATTPSSISKLSKTVSFGSPLLMVALKHDKINDSTFEEILIRAVIGKAPTATYYGAARPWINFRRDLSINLSSKRLGILYAVDYQLNRQQYGYYSNLEKEIRKQADSENVFKSFLDACLRNKVSLGSHLLRSKFLTREVIGNVPASSFMDSNATMSKECTNAFNALLSNSLKDDGSKWELFMTLLPDFEGSVKELIDIAVDM